MWTELTGVGTLRSLQHSRTLAEMWEGPQRPDPLIIKPRPRIRDQIESMSTARGPLLSLFDKPFCHRILFDVVRNVAELLSRFNQRIVIAVLPSRAIHI